MNKIILVVLALLFCSSLAYAEPSFDQIQGLIKEKNYSAAVQGLTLVIQNHPRSAKAYYAMAQAQAGIGNQAKAKEALDMAIGIDPSLKFASSGNVENLKEAIQPQTKKIEAVESHGVRNTLIFLFLVGIGVGCYFLFRRKEEEVKPTKPQAWPEDYASTTAPKSFATGGYVKTGNSRPILDSSYQRPAPSVQPSTTVINNNSNDGLIAGMLIGQAIGSHDHHNTVVEKEIIHETPVVKDEPEQKSLSWDDDKSSSSSSSWESRSDSSSSSSWDSSSSSSSSSWDSSSSSSSWDSSSSSSDSS